MESMLTPKLVIVLIFAVSTNPLFGIPSPYHFVSSNFKNWDMEWSLTVGCEQLQD